MERYSRFEHFSGGWDMTLMPMRPAFLSVPYAKMLMISCSTWNWRNGMLDSSELTNFFLHVDHEVHPRKWGGKTWKHNGRLRVCRDFWIWEVSLIPFSPDHTYGTHESTMKAQSTFCPKKQVLVFFQMGRWATNRMLFVVGLRGCNAVWKLVLNCIEKTIWEARWLDIISWSCQTHPCMVYLPKIGWFF